MSNSTDLQTMSELYPDSLMPQLPQNTRFLAELIFEGAPIAFAWSAEDRSVWISPGPYGTQNQWHRQQDMNILDSLCAILGLIPESVRVEGLEQDGAPLPQNLAQNFLHCDWSDYACDHRAVRGHIFGTLVTQPPVLQSSAADSFVQEPTQSQ